MRIIKKKSFFKGFLRRACGGAVIEFALVMPLLIIIFGGLYDYAYYTLLHNKLARASGTVAFIVSKQDIKASSLTAILANAFVIVQPFNFKTQGTIITSQVGLNSNSAMVINWQQKSGSAFSKIGNVGAAPINLPNNIKITNQERLIVTEVFYNYEPIFPLSVLTAKTIYIISVYPPRVGLMDSLLAG